MDELEPGQPGKLFGDGQLADRRRSIQQNQFHNALSYSMLLQPHAEHNPLATSEAKSKSGSCHGWVAMDANGIPHPGRTQ